MSIEHSPNRILRTKEIVKLTGWSRTTIWRKVRSGDFPAPLALGPNSNGWTEELYASWLASLPKVDYAPADDGAEVGEAVAG